LGHDLDLSWSRDVIGHMTIRFPKSHFLLFRQFFGKTYRFATNPTMHSLQTTDGRNTVA